MSLTWHRWTAMVKCLLSVLTGSVILLLIAGGSWGALFLLEKPGSFASSNQFRPSEGRLTGETLCKPYSPGRSHAAPVSPVLVARMRELSRLHTSQARTALGALELRTGDVKGAVEKLESAVGPEKFRAGVMSDLSAALIAESATGDAYSLVRSLRAAEEAIRLNPSLREAFFNKALAMSKLSMPTAGRAAWADYLRIDSGSCWAEEARHYLSSIGLKEASQQWRFAKDILVLAVAANNRSMVDRIAQRFPQATREYAEERLITNREALCLEGDQGRCERAINAIQIIAESLADVSGDRLLLDELGIIKSRLAARRKEELHALESGYRLFNEGQSAYIRSPRQALGLFRRASKSLHQSGSYFAAWSDLWVAICLYQEARYPESLALLEQLRTVFAAENHPAVTARSLWISGLVCLQIGQLVKSVAAYNESLSIFQKMGEAENLASVQSRLSLVLHSLGAREEAWKLQSQALSSIGRFRDPARAGAVFEIAAFEMLEEGDAKTASYYQDQFVASARRALDPVVLAEALQWRAESLKRLGQTSRAMFDLMEALKCLDRVTDQGMRRIVEGDIGLREGSVLAESDPARALLALNRSLNIYRSTNYRFRIPSLQMARALAHLGNGNLPGAESDLEAGIQAFEEIRSDLSADLRAGFFEESSRAFSAMIQLQLASGDQEAAFDYLERSRSRSLLDLMSGSVHDGVDYGAEGHPAPISKIRAYVAPDAAIIEYFMCGKQLQAWLITRERVIVRKTTLADEGDLASLVRAMASRSVDESIARDAAGRLYDILVKPFWEQLERKDHLIVIPDPKMNGISFAALWMGETQKFLIERFTISFSPSATIYLQTSDRLRAIKRNVRSILAVGNPLINRKLFQALPILRRSEAEIAAAIQAYPVSDVLAEERATPERFLREAVSFDVIHIASHALTSLNSAASPMLVLSGNGSDSGGVVSVEAISSLLFNRTRVVVLASCSSGGGKVVDLEGVENLARPFLIAGVPVVIISLWSVDDNASDRFWRLFHARIVAKASPSEALRDAQLDAIGAYGRSFHAARHWAAFQTFGGS